MAWSASPLLASAAVGLLAAGLAGAHARALASRARAAGAHSLPRPPLVHWRTFLIVTAAAYAAQLALGGVTARGSKKGCPAGAAGGSPAAMDGGALPAEHVEAMLAYVDRGAAGF